MKAARAPRTDNRNVKLLVVKESEMKDRTIASLPDELRTGDLLVVNDAATLPASIRGRDEKDNPLEIRLVAEVRDQVWQAVLLGAGDWQLPTELRPLPPVLSEGEDIFFAEDFRARIVNGNLRSNRFVELSFNRQGEALWHELYRQGKPVQYSYLQTELPLWSVQNVYSSRPWAVEMPSAGHALNWQLLLQLLKKGIQIVSLTHGAGLSSTGDVLIDQALPLGEKFEIPAATMEAVKQTKINDGRVIAIGTSVVRALESATQTLSGWTELKIGSEHRLKFVDGLLTGTHEVSESHYQLLSAFLPASVLERMTVHLERREYLTHEFGDACLIFRRA